MNVESESKRSESVREEEGKGRRGRMGRVVLYALRCVLAVMSAN